MTEQEIPIKQVYEIVDKAKVEITGHILRLEAKFDSLEAGRVSSLEREMAEVRVNQGLIMKLVYGAVGVILLTVLGALLYLVIRT